MKNWLIVLTLYSILSTQYSLAQNKTDEKGRKQGYWEKVDPGTKKIIYKGTFKDDKPQGMFTYYYQGSDSVRTKMDFRQDGKIAYAQLFHFSGKPEAKGKYISEQKDSTWSFYDDKGTLISTEGYSLGKKNGTSKIFFPDGTIAEEKNYKNGLLEGPFKQFYPEKVLKAEGAYKNNTYFGKCAWYYINGTAAAQGVYDEKGIKKGFWLYKESDGKLKEKEVWVNGKKLPPKEMEEYLKKNKSAAENKPATNHSREGNNKTAKKEEKGSKK